MVQQINKPRLINCIQQYRIAIITCWYGPYPWYLPYFIHSCSYNPTIDFYIVTDNEGPVHDQPANVKVICKSLDAIKKAATEKLGFAINIDHPYKLCDFKPAYGYLFPELIQGYDFWGQCDMDLVWGNIRSFLTDGLMDSHDFINPRHDYTTGCFMLFRNTEQLNTLFMRSRDYVKVFSDERHYCFDECNFAHEVLKEGCSILGLDTEIESFTAVVRKAEAEEGLRAHFDFIIAEGTVGRLCFDRGTLIYKRQFEVLLYHLIMLKKVFSTVRKLKRIPNTYHISSTKIY